MLIFSVLVPIFSYASPKGAMVFGRILSWQLEILILYGPRVRPLGTTHVTVGLNLSTRHAPLMVTLQILGYL